MSLPAPDNIAAELSCEVCGRLPEPPKTRLTVASFAAMLPLELAAPAVIIHTALPDVVKILILCLVTCALGIWVAEPSAMRLLRSWLHAPALRHRRRLDTSAALWRTRTSIENTPAALKRLTSALEGHHVNILSNKVHPLDHTPQLPRGARVLVELVISVKAALTEQGLLNIIGSGRGRGCRVWPTTALAQADGQTKALSLAARIAANPDELPLAAAELLSAQIINPATTVAQDSRNILKIPSSLGPVLLSRPSGPFTTAESARVHRLAELAETVELTTRPPVPTAKPRGRPSNPNCLYHKSHPSRTRATSCHQGSRRKPGTPHTNNHSGSGRSLTTRPNRPPGTPTPRQHHHDQGASVLRKVRDGNGTEPHSNGSYPAPGADDTQA